MPICDNYKTHKTKEVQAWLAKHPRFKLHFTPTSSSWMNLVERLFAEIARQQIRRGVFKRASPNSRPSSKPGSPSATPNRSTFKWTAKADVVLEKKCACQARAGRRPSQQVLNRMQSRTLAKAFDSVPVRTRR